MSDHTVVSYNTAIDELEKYTRIFLNLNTIAVIHDLNGKILEVNKNFLDILGYSKSDIPSLSTGDLFAEENKDIFQKLTKETLSCGSSNYEITIRKKNRDTFPAYIYSGILEIGRTKVIQCVVHDITEQKNVERKLYETNKFLDSIIENIPDMVFLKDAEELRFVRFNKAGEKLLGYSREDLLGKNDYDFFPKEEADFFTKKDKATLQAENPIDIPEEEIHTKQKGKRTLHTKKISIRDEKGNPKYLLGISEDITERKQAEEVLRKSNEELEQAVKERTTDLLQLNIDLKKEVEIRSKTEEALEENLKHLSRKNRYEEIINIVTRSVHQSIDPDQVLENAVEVMHKKIDKLDIISIYMVEGKEAVLKIHRELKNDYIKKAGRIPYPIGVTWETIRSGKPEYIPDVEKDSKMGDAGKNTGAQSYMAVPIFNKGKVIGVLYLVSRHKNAFDKEELLLLEIVSRQLQSAINNAQQAQELKESKDELSKNIVEISRKSRYQEIISEVTQSVHKSIDLETVLDNSINAMRRNMDKLDSVAIHLVEGDEIVLRAQTGFTDDYVKRAGTIPYPKGATWQTIIEGKSKYVPDVDMDDSLGPADKDMGFKCYLIVPLLINQKAVGTFAITSFEKNVFDKEELKLLEIVSKQISIAIRNAKQAKALSKSEERYRTIVENTYDLIIETDVMGNISYANPRHKDILGYDPEELIGMNCLNIIHEDDRMHITAAFQRAASTEESIQTTRYRCKHKDGDFLWLESTGRAYREAKGEIRGVISSRDITAYKMAEDSSNEVQQRYRALVENSYDLIIEVNPDFKFLYVSPNHKSLLGYEQEELLGKGIFENIHPDDKQEISSNLQRIGLSIINLLGFNISDIFKNNGFGNVSTPETREVWRKKKGEIEKYLESENSLIYRYKTKDCKWIWLESTGKPFWTSSDELRIVISSRDITERIESEQKLQNAFSEIEQLKDRLEKENVYLKKEIELSYSHTDIIGNSKAIKSALSKIEQVAVTDATVLLTGETGTGKELFANRIHNLSSRKDRAMVKVNCAALPPHLIESELFGHEKGAFTGAVSKNTGRFEVADGSTIFLDEVAELPLELQSKLLRVLEEGELQRVGSSKTIKVDVRIVAASNNELLEAVNLGKFREDLFYRLNVFPVNIPSLRERREDIPDLLWFFISEFEKKMRKTIKNISSKDMENLINYSWPGNIRQLRNIIERSMIISSGLDLKIELPGIRKEKSFSEIKEMHVVERDHISQILNMTNWRIRGKSGAAELLGLKPTTLESRIKKLGIKRSH